MGRWHCTSFPSYLRILMIPNGSMGILRNE
ncbi:hypothetical protein F383_10245 [Gossypium arboreum]|uniref:Uncharacterized protein n=1 Tax=Gossypium arboreum TaxID=29729 RepID=A0A0B0PR64_GOSAR|nr:hypothetical protein F383_10245 [Gossypium arboreum]